MIIKLELADGTTEVFESQNYKISRRKDFHPAIISVTVIKNGFVIKKVKRFFALWYKLVTFKSEKVQNELKKIIEAEKK